jgi:mannose-1-phosphate guanylyltransferase/phosphomannomutase
MKAVVMAGGFGSRIQPLTHSTPKPMLPLLNRPMMEHTMLKLRDLGITDFIVLLYYKPEIIKDYFQDGSDMGMNISYITPDDDYGTAGAVKKAQELIGDENFVIISGDVVTDFDFKKMFDFHNEKQSKLTITLTKVENPLQFGVVITDNEGKIEKFLEKPSWGEVFSDTINTGIYIIEPEILDQIPANENYDFGKDLFPSLMQSKTTLWGYDATGYWRDVGNPESYREVYEDVFSGRVALEKKGEKIKYPDGTLHAQEKIELDPSVEIIGNVCVGKNVKIGKNVKLKNSVIGDNCTIEDSCKISNSVLWKDVSIGKNGVFDSCVICNDNKIEKNVSAKAGLILAEGCEVGQLVSFEKDVIIWPNKKIQDAAIVSSSLILGSKYKNSIFEAGKVTGKTNVELSCEMATKLAEALASQLPVGSKVMVSRDYHRSSLMLKRAFMSGLMSAGISIIDAKGTPISVMRHDLYNSDDIIAGVHFMRDIDPANTKVLFFTEEALYIDSNLAKTIERSFFRENFRRVDFQEIGQIQDANYSNARYKKAIYNAVDKQLLDRDNFRIAVDLTHGMLTRVYPEILNYIGVNNILINAYQDEQKLINQDNMIKRSKADIEKMVKNLELDIGFVIYPSGQKLTLICDEGIALDRQLGLLCVLYLYNQDATEKRKVFLPVWAPDVMDDEFENLEITRGQYANFKAEKLKEYDLVATLEGSFAFTEFSLHRDSTYATLKIMEMLIKQDIKLSKVIEEVKPFYYKRVKVECNQALKGKMMRKFLEDAKGKKSSMIDGVKIWINKDAWILMIPDQYTDNLNLYIQAKNDEEGQVILDEYLEKIENWKQD